MHQEQRSSFHTFDGANWIKSISIKGDKTIIVSHAFSIPQSFHFCRLSPSPEKKTPMGESYHTLDREASFPPPLYKTSESALLTSTQADVQQRSGLNHLFMGIKDIPLEMQVNANRLRICFGLLFVRWSTFASTFPFLL